MTQRPKVAVYGGTFNPVHNGHLALAEHILEVGAADYVYFMPVFKPVHKKVTKEWASYAKRVEMLGLALSGRDPRLRVSLIEKEIGKPSYTLNTLDELSHRWLDKEFAWCIGADELECLHTWDPDPIRLVRNYDFIVYLRPGCLVSLTALREHWPGWLCRKLLDGILWDAPRIPVSSSMIRDRIRYEGIEHVSDMVPDSVLTYIKENNLYK